MSSTDQELFDQTLHTTYTWLKDLMEELRWDDRQRAYRALRATLHALRDRLTVEEAAHLGAQLPMLIRGVYYEGWHPASTPVKERQKAEFVAHVKDAFRREEDFDPERVVRGVFNMLARRITAGEIADIKHTLPPELRQLWPESRQEH